MAQHYPRPRGAEGAAACAPSTHLPPVQLEVLGRDAPGSTGPALEGPGPGKVRLTCNLPGVRELLQPLPVFHRGGDGGGSSRGPERPVTALQVGQA